jgi:hypothetical protein
MNRPTVGACAVVAGMLCTFGANADEKNPSIVQFNGAIGSQPFANVGGVAVANDVLGIAPGGRPWELRKLRASVDVNGVLRLAGKGLLLGGGNNIGRPANPRSIQATLFCNEGGTNLAWNSAAAELDAQGNFSINGLLTPVAPNLLTAPPYPCNLPILLIRNSTAATTPGGSPVPGPWFAAGIPGGGDDD